MYLTDAGVSSASLATRELKATLAARRLEQLGGLFAGQVIEEEIARELVEHVGDYDVRRRVGVLQRVASSDVGAGRNA
jgi:hypothetical protein